MNFYYKTKVNSFNEFHCNELINYAEIQTPIINYYKIRLIQLVIVFIRRITYLC